MPLANGDYVKVYLYILRLVVSGSLDFTTHTVAKQLNLIESDVIRALHYWSDQKILEVVFDEDELVSVGFLSLEKTNETITSTAPVKEKKKVAKVFDRPQYSMEEMALFSEQDDFKQLLYITERYLQKPLSQTDVNTLLGFTDWLGLPFDVVEFLIEYCASNGHRHMNYIEKVAIDWSERNIKSIEQAKNHTDSYNNSYYRIFKSLGLGNRQPTPKEIKYMDRWVKDYNFALEVIELACEKTISSINQPSLSYVDTILTRWHNKGVKSVDAVAELDRTYKEEKKSKKKPTTNSKNKFHNHNQRQYDYDDLEKKMNDLLDKKSIGMG